MRKPLIISLTLHALVLLFAVVTFPTFGDKLPAPPTPLPVDLVTPAELTKVKAGKRDAEEKPAKAEKKPEPPAKKEAKKTRPSKVKSVKAPAAKPAPKPEKAEPAPRKAEPKKPEPKKVAKADPGPVPVPARKPRKPVVKPKPKVAAKKPAPAPKKKKNFDPDKIAALLNKVPDAGPKPAPKAAPEPQRKPEPAKGREAGKDLAMTFNEIDALRAKISQCWNPPVGGLGADAIQVKLRLQLTQEGSLTSTPQVMNRSGSPFFQAAADAAVRAVMLCQPYQLPSRKYALWRDMILNFDPREMFGG